MSINPKSVEFHQCHANPHSICFFITISKITKEIFAKICWQLKAPTRTWKCRRSIMQMSYLYASYFPFNKQKRYEKHVWEKSNDAYSLSIRVQSTIKHISILPTNGCSLELCIPFPLLLRPNNMHVLVSSPPIIFLVTFAAKFPEYGNLLLIGQFKERNAEREWAAVSGEDRCVTTLITAAKETIYHDSSWFSRKRLFALQMSYNSWQGLKIATRQIWLHNLLRSPRPVNEFRTISASIEQPEQLCF